MNGHGGHIDELKNAAMKVHREKKIKIAVIHWWILCEELTKKFFGETGGHAGLDENAAVLAINKDLVKKRRYKKDLVYLQRGGAYSLPGPGSIIIYKEGEGYPDFDEKKAISYMDKVVKKVKDDVLEIFRKWDQISSE
jgi:creatinine amidohydrolase